MSVRSSILVVLTLGAAYGLQVHAQIETRTSRPGEINVGQIYSTLSRLRTSGLIDVVGTTADGLPLYDLTVDGRAEALRGLSAAEPSTGTARSGWAEMVDHVLLVSSLPEVDATCLVESYRELWRAVVSQSESGSGSAAALSAAAEHAVGDEPGELRLHADRLLADAALRWLDQVLLTPPARVALVAARPRRGRRPSLASL